MTLAEYRASNEAGVAKLKENDMAKTPKTTDDAGKALAPNGEPDSPGVPGEAETEPKFGKVEARLAALEAYVKDNAKALGWPEFKG